MSKFYEIKARVQELTGLPVMDDEGTLSVLIDGDHPEMISVIAAKLEASGLPFSKVCSRKFKGAVFTLPIRNIGTALHANWEFAS